MQIRYFAKSVSFSALILLGGCADDSINSGTSNQTSNTAACELPPGSAPEVPARLLEGSGTVLQLSMHSLVTFSPLVLHCDTYFSGPFNFIAFHFEESLKVGTYSYLDDSITATFHLCVPGGDHDAPYQEGEVYMFEVELIVVTDTCVAGTFSAWGEEGTFVAPRCAGLEPHYPTGGLCIKED